MADGTQAINRAIRLLKAFDDVHPRWDVSALASEAGLTRPTTSRILGALEQEGLLERAADGDYRLGSELIVLGGRARRAHGLRDVARPELERLSVETGETTTLELLRADPDGGWSMLVVDEVVGHHLLGITQYIGNRLPLHATSTGKATLAQFGAERRAALLDGTLRAHTGRTLVDRSALEADLVAARARGYALADSELEEGLLALGAPLFDQEGEVVAAISLVCPSVRVPAAESGPLAERLLATAKTISRRLGYRGG